MIISEFHSYEFSLKSDSEFTFPNQFQRKLGINLKIVLYINLIIFDLQNLRKLSQPCEI